jgi:hypothetical protein
MITPQLHPSPPSSFGLFVATLEPWEQELIQDVTFQYDVYHFVQMLIKITLYTRQAMALLLTLWAPLVGSAVWQLVKELHVIMVQLMDPGLLPFELKLMEYCRICA